MGFDGVDRDTRDLAKAAMKPPRPEDLLGEVDMFHVEGDAAAATAAMDVVGGGISGGGDVAVAAAECRDLRAPTCRHVGWWAASG